MTTYEYIQWKLNRANYKSKIFREVNKDTPDGNEAGDSATPLVKDEEKEKHKDNDIENSLPMKEQLSIEKKHNDEISSSGKIVKASSSEIDEKMKLTGEENKLPVKKCNWLSCLSRDKSTKQIKSASFTS